MLIRSINSGSNILSILDNTADGKASNYIISDNPHNDIERITAWACHKADQGYETFIKVKFDWKFGDRARVLEVVAKQNSSIIIYKFVNLSNFDKHTIDLMRIKDELASHFNIDHAAIQCCLVTMTASEAAKVAALLNDMGCIFDVEHF